MPEICLFRILFHVFQFSDIFVLLICTLHCDVLSKLIKIYYLFQTYEYMSEKYFTHASPTLFNAGTPKPQMSSCFLLTMKDDSIEGIYDTLKQCALISKNAGGIGLNVHCIRATGSYIAGQLLSTVK